jgi:hypothetical protein
MTATLDPAVLHSGIRHGGRPEFVVVDPGCHHLTGEESMRPVVVAVPDDTVDPGDRLEEVGAPVTASATARSLRVPST